MKFQTAVVVGLAAFGTAGWLLALASPAPTATVVRIAQLEIDAAQLPAYTAAVKEEMKDAVRLEPGVIAIYAVAEKGDPTKLFFFEIYRDESAYVSHREAPHFKKYLAITQPMIRSRRLIEAVPVQLSHKTTTP